MTHHAEMMLHAFRLALAVSICSSCVSATAPSERSPSKPSTYEGYSTDSSDGGSLSRLRISGGNFSIQFVRNGVLVAGDPGMGGGLRVENEDQYFYVRGLGLLIGHPEVRAFKAGISACSVDALPNGNKTTVCRYPDGRVSSRAVMAHDGRLLELIAPCAGGSMCNYKLVDGGYVDWPLLP